MTFNLTVLTPETIYQSADYQLFDAQKVQAVAMPFTKAVTHTEQLGLKLIIEWLP